MAITRTLTNGQKLTDWTQEINDLPNMYGLVNGSGLFSGKGTSQLSLIFDKTTSSVTLIDPSKRAAGPAVKGNDRKVETFALTLPYFLMQDYITPQDVQSNRAAGTPDSPETLASVIATKLEDMKANADQTIEFMKLEALKGVTIDPQGNELADMFDELGVAVAESTFEWDLQGAATKTIDTYISELKRYIGRSSKTGGRAGKIEVMLTPTAFDTLVGHSDMIDAYKYYQVKNNRSDVVRADMARFEDWGVVDTFEHKGILFYSYDAEFTTDDGDGTSTTRQALGADLAVNLRGRDAIDGGVTMTDANAQLVGYTVIRGMRNLYNGVYGPANTLSGANAVGSEIMMYQYRDPKDKSYEMELEMANLYWMARPQLACKIVFKIA